MSEAKGTVLIITEYVNAFTYSVIINTVPFASLIIINIDKIFYIKKYQLYNPTRINGIIYITYIHIYSDFETNSHFKEYLQASYNLQESL